MSKEFNNVRVVNSALTNEIMIARFGKKPNVALQRRVATPEIMAAVVNYVFNDMGDAKSVEFKFTLDNIKYVMKLKKIK